jgi:hypothetical protein
MVKMLDDEKGKNNWQNYIIIYNSIKSFFSI